MVRLYLVVFVLSFIFLSCTKIQQNQKFEFQPNFADHSLTHDEYSIFVIGNISYKQKTDGLTLIGQQCPRYACRKSQEIKVEVSEDFYFEHASVETNFEYFEIGPKNHVNSYGILGTDFLLAFSTKGIVFKLYPISSETSNLGVLIGNNQEITFRNLTKLIVESSSPYDVIPCRESEFVSDFMAALCNHLSSTQLYISNDKTIIGPKLENGNMYVNHLFGTWPVREIGFSD